MHRKYQITGVSRGMNESLKHHSAIIVCQQVEPLTAATVFIVCPSGNYSVCPTVGLHRLSEVVFEGLNDRILPIFRLLFPISKPVFDHFKCFKHQYYHNMLLFLFAIHDLINIFSRIKAVYTVAIYIFFNLLDT